MVRKHFCILTPSPVPLLVHTSFRSELQCFSLALVTLLRNISLDMADVRARRCQQSHRKAVFFGSMSFFFSHSDPRLVLSHFPSPRFSQDPRRRGKPFLSCGFLFSSASISISCTMFCRLPPISSALSFCCRPLPPPTPSSTPCGSSPSTVRITRKSTIHNLCIYADRLRVF